MSKTQQLKNLVKTLSGTVEYLHEKQCGCRNRLCAFVRLMRQAKKATA